MLPAFGRVNSSPASFFTETSVVATSSRVIVCPTFAITEVGVDVLPVVVGVLPETVPVVAVVPQAMRLANRMSARRIAIDLRCDMTIYPFHTEKYTISPRAVYLLPVYRAMQKAAREMWSGKLSGCHC